MDQQPAYMRISRQLERQIRSGQRKPGEKLESIRQLAKTEGVSVNTIRSAMDMLAQTGLVLSQPRKGIVVASSSDELDYQPYEQFEPDARLARQSREWLNTAVAPDRASNLFVNMVVPTDNPLFKTFQRHYRQSLSSPPKAAVEMSAGNAQLREKLAELALKRQMRISAAEIQITNGCQNAIEHALRVICRPGDAVALPTPAFPGYLALLSLLRLKLIELPMTPAGPDPILLKKVMSSGQAKALIINPICHNPTGVSISDDFKRDIALWANQYNMPVIEDDICAELSFCEHHPRLIASFDKKGWVLLVSSISKLMGDSERIGWCFPGRFKDAYMTQCAVSQIGSSYYRQKALALYLNGSRFPSQLRQWRQDIGRAINQAKEMLDLELRDRVQITQPSGGYSLWVKLPKIIDAKKLRQQANKDGLDFLPGEFFSLQPRFKNYLRLVVIPPLTEKHKDELLSLSKLILQNL